MFRVLATATVATLFLSTAGAGRAETSPASGESALDGYWSASPLTTRWVIGQWADACGPKPSGGGEPGGTVTVHQVSGELQFSGAGRSYSTTQCWEQYPGLRRVNHSASARAWKTTCQMPPGDPRQETLSTSITATDTAISFYEAGQYQFLIQGQNCTASVGRYRTYTLIKHLEPQAAPPAASGAAKTAPAASGQASDKCAEPGPPAKVDVRPPKKLLKAGEEFTFRATVFDAKGCPLPAKPTWEITAGADRADTPNPGTVRVHADAPEGEVRLTATAGGRPVEVTIEVVSAERYNAVLSSGAFNAAGETDGGVAPAVATHSIGATSAVAEDRASGRKSLFVAIIGAVALVLAGVGGLLLRRARANAAAQRARYEAQRAEYEAALKAPRPGAAAPASAARPMAPQPAPASAARPTAPQGAVASAPAPASAPAVQGKVCPICGMQYGPNSRFCGKDGATLLPQA